MTRQLRNRNHGQVEPTILRLPNELLSHIFSYLPVFGHLYPGERRTSDFLILRVVCRRFRAICNEMQLGCPHTCDIASLWNSFYISDRRGSTRRVAPLLDILLADEHLTQCLEKREIGHFETLESFVAILEIMPQALRRVSFDGVWETVTIDTNRLVVQLLGFCGRLESVSFIDTDALPLASLGRHALSELRLERIYEFTGSLAALCTLRTFEYTESDGGLNIPWENLLPIGSSVSLRQLSIIQGIDQAIYKLSMETLSVFVNLTALHLEPLSNDFCEFLFSSDLNLTGFGTRVVHLEEITASNLTDLFSAPFLRNLRKLKFSVKYQFSRKVLPTYCSCIESVISTITSRLILLEKIELSMEVNYTWCTRFNQILSLRSLVWEPATAVSFHDRGTHIALRIKWDWMNLDRGTVQRLVTTQLRNALRNDLDLKIKFSAYELPGWDHDWVEGFYSDDEEAEVVS